MDPLLALLTVVVALATLAAASLAFGVDSRDGFDDRTRQKIG
jgi:hypothetical protein